MGKKKVTSKNLATVLIKLGGLVLDSLPEGQRDFCTDFDRFLDDLASQDMFGTEGQIDPRGDQRD